MSDTKLTKETNVSTEGDKEEKIADQLRKITLQRFGTVIPVTSMTKDCLLTYFNQRNISLTGNSQNEDNPKKVLSNAANTTPKTPDIGSGYHLRSDKLPPHKP